MHPRWILPAHLLQIGREQLRPYPNVVFRAIEVIDASLGEDGVVVTLADGVHVFARKLLLATGVKDELPAIEGFAQLWGKRSTFTAPSVMVGRCETSHLLFMAMMMMQGVWLPC